MPHEIGTPEYTEYLQSVTPGEAVDSYIREAQKANKKLVANTAKHFSQVFDNPLKGFPHNEEFEVSLKEGTFMKEYEDGEYIKGDEKMYVDIIKKGGGKNIKVYKPSRMDPQLSIDFNGGNVKKMSKDLNRVGDGTETIDESLVSQDLDEGDADASLKKKAEKTGMPFGVLKQVFKRGVAAWRTGHRPGTNPTQWGHARVNSFATKSKGTWGGADKDLAAKVRG